ncbi:MAG: tetratricopeptide repeat protein [Thermoguttaceae bacterium]|jgi:tetratricopeptide (TPR) repeat protein
MAPQEPPEPSEQPGKREPLSPRARKRLQKCFEVASKQTGQDNYDYATELFSQCVLGDPGNPLYVQNFVGNLQRKYGNNKKGGSLAQFKERGARSAVKKALGQSNWDEAIKNGVAILKINPWDVPTLTAMATASGSIAAEGEGGVYAGYADCELFYLKCAVEATPNDPEVCQQLGTALGKRGRFDEAIAFLHRAEKARPDDEEIKRAIARLAVEKTISQGKWDEEGRNRPSGGKSAPGQPADDSLTPEQRLKNRVARQPDDMSGYHELAQFYLMADRYPEAEEVYAQALKVSDDPNIRETLEDIQIRGLRVRMVAADKRFKESRDPADKAEFERIRTEMYNKELALYQSRCVRFPNKLDYRYELAIRHKNLGGYNEAIRELQVARNDPRNKGRCLLALGECFQNIRQLPLAMRQYEAAIQEIPDRDTDNKKKALYRAGKLSFQTDDLATAERHLTTLAAMDYAYRDVADLLDKIAKRRNDEELGGQRPPD